MVLFPINTNFQLNTNKKANYLISFNFFLRRFFQKRNISVLCDICRDLGAMDIVDWLTHWSRCSPKLALTMVAI